MVLSGEYLSWVQLLFDFGLVVLIWIVQLIIYPSFGHYAKTDLLSWHQGYTIRISLVVVPLMFGQLFLTIFQLTKAVNLGTLTNMLLVLAVWISTFAQFVPMHNAISKGDVNKGLLRRLVALNWLRTFLWSLIFLFNLWFSFS